MERREGKGSRLQMEGDVRWKWIDRAGEELG